MEKEKNLELDRLVFFSDAVVAIAITLLALDLQLTPAGEHLAFSDIWNAWPRFLAFFLSFFMIAMFWKIHHEFFFHIQHIDEKLMGFNLAWLVFITTLPFTTSLLSEHLSDLPAIFLYCLNIFMLSIFQNFIWDYACDRLIYLPGVPIASPKETLLKPGTSGETITLFRLACNIAMANALLALLLSLWWPAVALVVLFSRIIFFRTAAIQWMERGLERRGRFGRGKH